MRRDRLKEKFFLEELTPAELDELDVELKEDKDFYEKFEEEKSAQLVIKHQKRDELKAQLLPKLEKIEREILQAKRRRRRNWSIAASLLLIIGLGSYFSTINTMSGLFDDYYSPYPNSEIMITRDSPDNLETQAFSAYEAENYEEAVELFLSLKNESDPPSVDLYLGIAYLELDNTAEAIGYFDQEINENGKYHSEALWYSVLAHIKDKDKSGAKKKLEDLINRKDYKEAEARELLEKLN